MYVLIGLPIFRYRTDIPFCDHAVLDLFLTRAVAERLPAKAPLVPVNVNPGYCRSELRREANLFVRFVMGVQDLLQGWTSEQGSRQLVYAALGPDGKDGDHAFFLKGQFVSALHVKEPSDFAMSKAGKDAQDRIWVSPCYRPSTWYEAHQITIQEETVQILSKRCPEVRECVEKYLKA